MAGEAIHVRQWIVQAKGFDQSCEIHYFAHLKESIPSHLQLIHFPIVPRKWGVHLKQVLTLNAHGKTPEDCELSRLFRVCEPPSTNKITDTHSKVKALNPCRTHGFRESSDRSFDRDCAEHQQIRTSKSPKILRLGQSPARNNTTESIATPLKHIKSKIRTQSALTVPCNTISKVNKKSADRPVSLLHLGDHDDSDQKYENMSFEANIVNFPDDGRYPSVLPRSDLADLGSRSASDTLVYQQDGHDPQSDQARQRRQENEIACGLQFRIEHERLILLRESAVECQVLIHFVISCSTLNRQGTTDFSLGTLASAELETRVTADLRALTLDAEESSLLPVKLEISPTAFLKYDADAGVAEGTLPAYACAVRILARRTAIASKLISKGEATGKADQFTTDASDRVSDPFLSAVVCLDKVKHGLRTSNSSATTPNLITDCVPSREDICIDSFGYSQEYEDKIQPVPLKYLCTSCNRVTASNETPRPMSETAYCDDRDKVNQAVPVTPISKLRPQILEQFKTEAESIHHLVIRKTRQEVAPSQVKSESSKIVSETDMPMFHPCNRNLLESGCSSATSDSTSNSGCSLESSMTTSINAAAKATKNSHKIAHELQQADASRNIKSNIGSLFCVPKYSSVVKVDLAPSATTNDSHTITCFFVLTFSQGYEYPSSSTLLELELRSSTGTSLLMARVNDASVSWTTRSECHRADGSSSQVIQMPHAGFLPGQAFCLVTSTKLEMMRDNLQIRLPSVRIVDTIPSEEQILLARIRYPLFVELDPHKISGWEQIASHDDGSDRWKFQRSNPVDCDWRPMMVGIRCMHKISFEYPFASKSASHLSRLEVNFFEDWDDSLNQISMTLRAKLVRRQPGLHTEPLLRVLLGSDAVIRTAQVNGYPAQCYRGTKGEVVFMDSDSSTRLGEVEIYLEYSVQRRFAARGDAITFSLPTILDISVTRYLLILRLKTAGSMGIEAADKSCQLFREAQDRYSVKFEEANPVSCTEVLFRCEQSDSDDSTATMPVARENWDKGISKSSSSNSRNLAYAMSPIAYLRQSRIYFRVLCCCLSLALLVVGIYGYEFVGIIHREQGLGMQNHEVMHEVIDRLNHLVDFQASSLQAVSQLREETERLSKAVIQTSSMPVCLSPNDLQDLAPMDEDSTLDVLIESDSGPKISIPNEADLLEMKMRKFPAFAIDPAEKQAFKSFVHNLLRYQ